MNNKKSCRLSSTCCFVRLNAYTNVYTLLYVEKGVKLNPRTTDCSLSECTNRLEVVNSFDACVNIDEGMCVAEEVV